MTVTYFRGIWLDKEKNFQEITWMIITSSINNNKNETELWTSVILPCNICIVNKTKLSAMTIFYQRYSFLFFLYPFSHTDLLNKKEYLIKKDSLLSLFQKLFFYQNDYLYNHLNYHISPHHPNFHPTSSFFALSLPIRHCHYL